MSARADVLPVPPVAPRRTSIRELHGETAADDFAWMRDRNDPALAQYLADERAFYDARSQRLDTLTAKLASEAAGRIPDGAEDSVSWRRGGFTYRIRVPRDRDNPQLLRSTPGEGAERVMLDDNLVAAQTGFADVGVREPSPDGALLAWSLDTSGAEIYELRIRELGTGEDLPEVIARASGPAFTTSGTFPNVAWSADSRHLFYLVPDELNRLFQVWRHRVGTTDSADVLVLEEPDQRFELTMSGSRSGELVIITAASRDTTEVRVIRASSPLADPAVIQPRRRGTEYRIDHAIDNNVDGGTSYIVTDDGTPEFTLMRAPLSSPGQVTWSRVSCEAIAPARSDTRLLRCDVFADHLLLTMRRDGSPLLAITDHDGGNVREVRPSLNPGSIRVEHAEEYDSGSVIIAEESLIDPPAWYRLDLDTGERELLKRMEVPGYDVSSYRSDRRTAPAGNGTSIPVTLAYRDGTPLDGSAPCLMYGYGAYEDCLDPEFDRSLASLLDRGVILAVAHVRGGGECGRHWWQQGRLRAKPTTFTDFIAVADWLASDGLGLVDGTRIVSRGVSAGGLLQGAVYSMRPDRWRAVVAEVPFVDCVNTMLDASIPLTVTEWDEWGDPRVPDDYSCMRSYSPYENPPAGPRPALLVTGALHDARVAIHEPAKWVARLRATDTDSSRVLFRAELGVGAHSGPTGRRARFGYEAEIQAFILDGMGITA
ncbi:MAG: prolyl oligopeptidase family serine peptidase [Actinomycetota bacterium]|nr:prolyl oligopeptidase family serine peptidase [Actinomycetota bacterium]